LSDTTTTTSTQRKVQRPALWTVVFLNDDYTPMQFVVRVLIEVFDKPQEEAILIMMEVHKRGAARVGAYTYEVAEQKVNETMRLTFMAQHPLRVFAERL
jgi:ATP-dependent Clp protease adaptor protein ClpS